MKKNKNIILNGLIDLAQPRLGTKVVYKTDDFFAAAKRIIESSPPIFKEGVFDKNGNPVKKHFPANGQVYFLNTGLKHWAENNSNENRIHLIVDTKNQEDLYSLQNC